MSIESTQDEQRPWVGNLRHSRELCDDWGSIRDEAGNLIITVPVTVPHAVALWMVRNDFSDPIMDESQWARAA